MIYLGNLVDQLDRIENKIEKITDILQEHGEILAKHSVILAQHGVLHEKNAAELERHVRRCDVMEDHMEASHKEMRKDMETEHKDMKKQLSEALLPVKSFKFLVGFAGGLCTLIGLYYLLSK